MADFWRPTKLPIDPFGTPDTGFSTMRVTSPYGERADSNFAGFHGGLDIGNARLGDEVTAIGDGTVISATDQPIPPWNYAAPADKIAVWGPSYGGKVVVVQHETGVHSQYAHLGSMRVAKGDRVTTAQVIGLIGDSGSAAPPPNGGGGHLHFGIRLEARVGNGHNGWVDPWPRIQPTGPYEDPAVIAELRDKLSECQEVAKRRGARIRELEARAVKLRAKIAELEGLDAVELLNRLTELRDLANQPLPEA